MAPHDELMTIEVVPPEACGQDAQGVWQGDSGVRLLRLNNTHGSLNSLTMEMAAAFGLVFDKLLQDTGVFRSVQSQHC